MPNNPNLDPAYRGMQWTVACIWLATGLITLYLYPLADSISLVNRLGIHEMAAAVVNTGAILDLAMGILTLLRPSRWLWLSQMALTVLYSACIAIYLPEFLIHPFGPVLKNLPFLTLLALLYRQTPIRT